MITMIRPGPVPKLDFEIERLRQLADDLEQMRQGRHPTREQLATAPTIDRWNIVARPGLCLMGNIYGHPRIGEGNVGITTDIWALASGLGFARTLSRFYVLARREDASLAS